MMPPQKLLKPRLPFRGKIPWVILLILIPVTFFLPWVSFTTGTGKVTAIDPTERIQSLTMPVKGFIKKWHVKEGQFLKKGDVIAEFADNDPDLLERYEREMGAAKKALESARLMKDTAEINLRRQEKLFQQGLAARKDYEKARIDYSKLDMDVAKSLVSLTKAETQLSRLSEQRLTAPRDGTIVRILPGEKNQLFKAGTPIAVFAPEVQTPAVELWVDGNDVTLVTVGQKAQVAFEGWPSLQIPGWPSLAINTFDAKVQLVDQASSFDGKFRVLIVPEGKWPSSKIVRVGIHAKGYIALTNTFILREIWRQLNNFPAYSAPIEDELKRLLDGNQKR